MARFGCPHCESPNVGEANVARADMLITEWHDDGRPAAFGEPSEVEWESDKDATLPLTCWNCMERFAWHDVVRVEDDDAAAAEHYENSNRSCVIDGRLL